MKVEVRLFATLRQNRFRNRELDAPEQGTVEEVLRQLHIDSQEVAILLVNGRDATIGQPLHDGDVVSLFPLVAGG